MAARWGTRAPGTFCSQRTKGRRKEQTILVPCSESPIVFIQQDTIRFIEGSPMAPSPKSDPSQDQLEPHPWHEGPEALPPGGKACGSDPPGGWDAAGHFGHTPPSQGITPFHLSEQRGKQGRRKPAGREVAGASLSLIYGGLSGPE